MRGEKVQVRKGREKKKKAGTTRENPQVEKERKKSQAGGRVPRCVQWRTVKARAGEGRKSRQAEWSGWSFFRWVMGCTVWYGLYGWMGGWQDGWMDEWMDGLGYQLQCWHCTALSFFQPPVNEICQVSSRFQFPAERSVWPFALALPSLPFLCRVFLPRWTAGWVFPFLSLSLLSHLSPRVLAFATSLGCWPWQLYLPEEGFNTTPDQERD